MSKTGIYAHVEYWLYIGDADEVEGYGYWDGAQQLIFAAEPNLPNGHHITSWSETKHAKVLGAIVYEAPKKHRGEHV